MARILLAGSHGTPTSYDETCYCYSTCFSSSCTVYGYAGSPSFRILVANCKTKRDFGFPWMRIQAQFLNSPPVSHASEMHHRA
jgi:hypothetical protein